jgi:hypothetical protein
MQTVIHELVNSFIEFLAIKNTLAQQIDLNFVHNHECSAISHVAQSRFFLVSHFCQGRNNMLLNV